MPLQVTETKKLKTTQYFIFFLKFNLAKRGSLAPDFNGKKSNKYF